MQKKTNIHKIWDAVTNVLVGAVVLLAVLLVGLRLAGLRVFNVVSGSMEPKYSLGDLIYVKSVDPDTIQVGDDITFILNEDLLVATHQVISVDKEHNYFYTKGLANATADAAPVHFKNVIGRPVFRIPKLGYVSDYIQQPPGMYVAIGFGLALLAVVLLPDMLPKKKEEPTSDNNPQQDTSAN